MKKSIKRKGWWTLWVAAVTAIAIVAPACLPACGSYPCQAPTDSTHSPSCQMRGQANSCCRHLPFEDRPVRSGCSLTAAGSCVCHMAAPLAVVQEAPVVPTDSVADLPAPMAPDRELLRADEYRPVPAGRPRGSSHRFSPPRAPPLSERSERA